MSNENKDYSLLRPFDLEAAKRGEAICYHGDGDVLLDVTVTKAAGICGRWDNSDKELHWTAEKCNEVFRMAPLCWVEGRPVYRGDVLHHKSSGQKVTAHSPADSFHIFAEFEHDGLTTPAIAGLTWTPPKVKREVKLFAWFDSDQLFWLREGAEPKWPSVRVPAEDKVIEIEEPAEGGAK